MAVTNKAHTRHTSLLGGARHIQKPSTDRCNLNTNSAHVASVNSKSKAEMQALPTLELIQREFEKRVF